SFAQIITNYYQAAAGPLGNAKIPAPPIRTYYCPADPRSFTDISNQHSTPVPGTYPYTDYTGIAGFDWKNQIYGYNSNYYDTSIRGVFDVNSTMVRMTDITDGTSNTLLVGERPPFIPTDNGYTSMNLPAMYLNPYSISGVANVTGEFIS